MENKVSEKYIKLHKACSRYPKIVLSNIEERDNYLGSNNCSKIYVSPKKHANNGFIEKFCFNLWE